MRKAIVIVIDGFGVGALPDANLFGDEGSNTFLNLINNRNIHLDTLKKLGLYNIVNLPINDEELIGSYGKLKEISKGKDTTTGHFEMMGIITETAMPTFPNGFPKEVIKKLEDAFHTKILGNVVASGTEIIKALGNEHLKTGYPIVYTSSDSVLQIATNTEKFSLSELYELCEKARKIMNGKYSVGRVIARPFTTVDKEFKRLADGRKDFSILPPEPNILNDLQKFGITTIGVGKIADIFANKYLDYFFNNHSNDKAFVDLGKALKIDADSFIFVNLVDTDMLYGHRNDIVGYANCLEKIDIEIKKIISNLNDEDILIVTGDHGNDPTTISTDHSREYTPFLIYGKSIKPKINLGILNGFNNVGEVVYEFLTNNKKKNSGLDILSKLR